MNNITNIIEMIIADELDGVNAISIVDRPAIESNFVYLSKDDVTLKEVDTEKRILMGAALIPDKHILRKGEEGDYYIYFSQKTVRQASEKFLLLGNQGNATIQHSKEISGVSLVESWIVEDPSKDKSSIYLQDIPKGTWMVSMKIYDDEIWDNFVKTGKVKGFSIEGLFDRKVDMSDAELFEKVLGLLK